VTTEASLLAPTSGVKAADAVKDRCETAAGSETGRARFRPNASGLRARQSPTGGRSRAAGRALFCLRNRANLHARSRSPPAGVRSLRELMLPVERITPIGLGKRAFAPRGSGPFRGLSSAGHNPSVTVSNLVTHP
jgi:hypothetical protein